MNTKSNYEEFLQLCADGIKERHPGVFETEVCTAVRNNAVEVKGLLIKQEGEALAPNFYLTEQFRAWSEGRITVEEIVREICSIYYEEIEKNRRIVDEIKFTWEEFKKHVYVRLVSRDRNAKLLQTLPHEEYLDMAVTYYYVIEITSENRGIMMITQEHLKHLGVSAEELREAAWENTERQGGPRITGMQEMLTEMGKRLGVEFPEVQEENCMYILSNESGTYGAVCMLMPGILEEFSCETGYSFYILPSSIHEVLLVPDTGEMCAEVLSDMVKDVNATQLEESEILTDSVYYYDRTLHVVRRVA